MDKSQVKSPFEQLQEYVYQNIQLIFCEEGYRPTLEEYKPGKFRKIDPKKSIGHGFFSGIYGTDFKKSVYLDLIYGSIQAIADYFDYSSDLEYWESYFGFVKSNPFRNPERLKYRSLTWQLYRAMLGAQKELENIKGSIL